MTTGLHQDDRGFLLRVMSNGRIDGVRRGRLEGNDMQNSSSLRKVKDPNLLDGQVHNMKCIQERAALVATL